MQKTLSLLFIQNSESGIQVGDEILFPIVMRDIAKEEQLESIPS